MNSWNGLRIRETVKLRLGKIQWELQAVTADLTTKLADELDDHSQDWCLGYARALRDVRGWIQEATDGSTHHPYPKKP